MLTEFGHVTLVDPNAFPSSEYSVVQERIEDLQPNGRYDHIVLPGVLEHLDDPVSVLKKLKGRGKVHIVVNLVGSLHRRLGVEMGLISHIEELAPKDIEHGHKRIYTPGLLLDRLSKSGTRLAYSRNFYLKPFPTSMMDFPIEVHQALDTLGQQLPEFASYVYAEAE